MYSVGVDIGGTFIKAGLVKDKKLVAQGKIPTTKENSEKQILDDISSLIDSLLESVNACRHCVDNIGIGVAGSHKNGVCLYMANTSWRNIKLNKLGKIYNCKVTVVNDLKGATLGELYFGKGKTCKDFVFVGLGTGLNIGVVKEDCIIDGVEFGHVVVDLKGEKCGCGKNGCLESLVSSKGLMSYAKQHCDSMPENIKQLFEMAKTNDSCKKAINQYLEYLNIGLINICNSYRPKQIVLGGGIGEGLRSYIKDINKKLKDSSYGYPTAAPTKVVVSNVGNNCGILGCSTLK